MSSQTPELAISVLSALLSVAIYASGFTVRPFGFHDAPRLAAINRFLLKANRAFGTRAVTPEFMEQYCRNPILFSWFVCFTFNQLTKKNLDFEVRHVQTFWICSAAFYATILIVLIGLLIIGTK